MRNSLWLALLLVSVSCTSSITLTSSNTDYLRCSTAASPEAPDTGPGGADTSIFGGATKPNDFSCISDATLCATLGTNFYCDTGKGCCKEKPTGRCNKSADCSDSTKPVCDTTSNNCVACSTMDKTLGNTQCSAYSTAQNDPLSQVLCIGGACHECLTNADCKRPGKGNCNTQTFTCGGCTDDSQCSSSSNICKVDGSLLVEPGDTVTNIGDCAKTTSVVYVDIGNAGCTTGDGSSAKPFCQISSAISSGKPYIRVRGYGTSQIYSPAAVGSGQKIVILGPSGGREPSSSQVVINGLNVTTGGLLTLQEVEVVTTMGAAAAVQCNGSTLFVKKVSIAPVGTQQPNIGISTTGCKVDVEKSKIYAALGYGIWITGGSGHRVVNNAIIENGGNKTTNQPYGMKLTGVTSGLFAFNTIAGNGQGVQCDSTVPVTNSIVVSNGAATDMQLSSNCQGQNFVANTGITLNPNYTTGSDPTLTDPMGLCIDKATADASVQDDYYGNPRGPGNGLYDIGFQEVK